MKDILFDKKMNRRGQFQSKLIAVIMLFIVGVSLVFVNIFTDKIFTGFDKYFNNSASYNGTEGHIALQEIHEVDNSVWDYAFLAIFIGFVLQIILFSFATEMNLAFYWIVVLVDIIVLLVGVALSNIWQEMAADPVMTVSLARYPITNSILGSYYPVMVVAIIFIASILMFYKRRAG